METGDMVGADLRRVAARKFLVKIFWTTFFFWGGTFFRDTQLHLDILG